MAKEYKIGKCTTVDVESGEDFVPAFYKVYSVEEYNGFPAVWYEDEFDTLEEAKGYIKGREYEDSNRH